jgi:hypothetical protein
MDHAAMSRDRGARAATTAVRHADDDAYVSVAETKKMLAGGLSERMARLAQADMMSTEEAALLNGTSRVTVNAWIAKGRAIGLTQNIRGFRLPRWQFEPALWGVLPRLSEALGTKEGWALLAFLETPLGALQDITPRTALERGHVDRVLQLARHDAG